MNTFGELYGGPLNVQFHVHRLHSRFMCYIVSVDGHAKTKTPYERPYNKKKCAKKSEESNKREMKEKNNYAIIDGKYPVIKTMKSILMQQIDTAWCKFFKATSICPVRKLIKCVTKNLLSNNAIFQLGVNETMPTTTTTSTAAPKNSCGKSNDPS